MLSTQERITAIRVEEHILDVTRLLFSAPCEIESAFDRETGGEFRRVVVRLRNADPDVIAEKHSKWHDLIMSMPEPKELIDNIRLKTVYE